MIYLVLTNKILDRLRKIISNKYKTFKEFSKSNELFEGTVLKRLRGDIAMPLSFFKNLIDEKDIFTILDGIRIRSKSRRTTIIIHKNISIQEAMFLGWFISEGCITKENKVFISQANKNLLKKLNKIIKESFNPSSELRITENTDNVFNLWLPSIFKHYLKERFGFTAGRKAHTIWLPTEIEESNKEVKLAFLASYLCGDGSVTFHKRNTNEGLFYVPEVGFSTSSPFLKEGIKNLLKSLDYHPYVQYNKKYKNFNILLTRYGEISRSFFDLEPYILDKKKIKRYKFLLSQQRLMKSILIKANNLVKDTYNYFGSYEKVANYIKKETGHKLSWYAIKNWSNGYHRQPLFIVLCLCDLLNKNYFIYLPKEYAGLLWINKKISRNDFETKRT